MNDTYTSRQPVYRAAVDTAYAELGQIADRLNQLRIRQEQITAAVQALKAVVQEAGHAATPVYAINSKTA
jgi:hypothetical protein